MTSVRLCFFILVMSLSPCASGHTKGLPWEQSGCQDILSPSPVLSRRSFAGLLALESKTELFVRIERPLLRNHGWFLLIHGLMDSHRAFDKVTELLIKQGYGVVRVDLRGFGLSLAREIHLAEKAGGSFKPSIYTDYLDHVRDLKELLVRLDQDFGVKAPQLVGHSMGGGLVMALLADPFAQNWVAPKATVIAPYVYRLDLYLAEKFGFYVFPMTDATSIFELWIPPLLRTSHEWLADMLVTNHQMRSTLSDFFDRMAATRGFQIDSKKFNELRSHHVESGIAMIKGLRNLNSVTLSSRIPPSIQVNLIYGKNDEVVEKGLATKLGRYLARRGGEVREIDGGHALLEQNPQLVTTFLLQQGAD